MIKYKIRAYIILQILLELFLTAISLSVADVVHRKFIGALPVSRPFPVRLDLLAIVLPLWAFVLSARRDYPNARNYIPKSDVAALLKTIAICGVLLFSSLAVLKISCSRMLIGIFLSLDIVILSLERLLFLRLIRLGPFNGRWDRKVIIVGINSRSMSVWRMILAHKEWGINVIGFVDCPVEPAEDLEKVPLLGRLEELESILDRSQVDEVIFVVSRGMLDQIRMAVASCQERGIKFRIPLDLFDHASGRIVVDDAFDWPFVNYEPTTHPVPSMMLKRLFDIVFASVVLLFLLPLFLLLALFIKLDSPGPVLFFQERCGRNRKIFRMVKFRTMVVGAELMRSRLANVNKMTGPVFKMYGDPRVTQIGRFLRKYSLDELPQFFNVFMGDMSIVGPRPPLPSEVSKYDRWQRRRLSMRPGLTCIWQVSGRNDIQFEDWMRLDIEYINKSSFLLDLKLILRTLPAMIRGTGC